MDMAANWGIPPTPGPFLQWQIEFIEMLQGAIDVSPNLLQVLLWLGSPLVMSSIAFLWSILVDFTGGIGMLAVLCEATIIAKVMQSVWKLPRPFWITRQLRVGEITPSACTHSTTFGFPALEVVLIAAAVAYLSAYVSIHKDRWSTWFYDHNSITAEARQRKLWIRVMSLVLVVSSVGVVLVVAESIAVLYMGINFVHDVIVAILVGLGVVTIHLCVIQPLVVNPMCRFSLRTNTSRGLFIPLLYSFVIGGLVPLLFSAVCFGLSSTISFPKREWESIAWAHCGSVYRITGDASTYLTVFKMSGVLCGLCVSFCPLLVKFVPVQLTFRRAGLSGIFARLAGYAFVSTPLVFTAVLVHIFGMREIYALQSWWLMLFGMIMEFAMYAIGTVWLSVCTPFLIHLWNERSIAMRILFYERLVYFRRARPIPLMERVQILVRRSLDRAERQQEQPISDTDSQASRSPQSDHPKDYVFPPQSDTDGASYQTSSTA